MGFRYRTQVGGGPALSYFQMEPATLEDLYHNYLDYRPDLRSRLDAYLPSDMHRIDALKNDDRYACAAARLQYARMPEALPNVADDMALAAYAKRYWNTNAGKATPGQYLDDFAAYGPQPYPANWA